MADIPSMRRGECDYTFHRGVKLDKRGRPYHNMDACRAVHMDRIRRVRDKALSALDVETIKALGRGDARQMSDVEERKQALRDLPATLDLSKAATVDQIKAIWPSLLAR